MTASSGTAELLARHQDERDRLVRHIEALESGQVPLHDADQKAAELMALERDVAFLEYVIAANKALIDADKPLVDAQD